MTISNRLTLEAASNLLAPDDVYNLSLPEIEMLFEELADLTLKAKRGAAVIYSIMDAKFSAPAAVLRRTDSKDTGTVNIVEDDRKIVADLPKKVVWNQDKLAAAIKVLRDEWQENPADYVETELKISETKYNAWPPMIKKLFADARTVSAGKQTFKIEQIKEKS